MTVSMQTPTRFASRSALALLLLCLLGSACSTEGGDQAAEPTASTVAAGGGTSAAEPGEATASFTAEVWADNWFALSVNGTLMGEDSVPITTERSFNSETFEFEASYPLDIAIEAKDFKETDSGLEYIGQPNQQLGDGGVIAQITDNATGEVVAATDDTWSVLSIHRAPLNAECEASADPDSACTFESAEAPDNWTSPDFDDSSWPSASIFAEADVRPKDGYGQIAWDASARLVWATDLEVDNTVLLRGTSR
ncbi:MAG: hypothetical protein R2754_11375 [Microthrixaceae bacterium]